MAMWQTRTGASAMAVELAAALLLATAISDALGFAGASFAQNFSDRFSAGITAKGIFDQLGEANGSAFGVDFGTNFHSQLNGHPIQFSFVLANLGTNLSYSGSALQVDAGRDPIPGQDPVPDNPQPAEFRTKDFPLPTVFRVGLAYDIGGEGAYASLRDRAWTRGIRRAGR